ncbi:hypothetical protein D3C76_983150 [compost metagenome]
MLFGFERETGRQNRAIQIARVAATQTVSVQLCALTTGCREQFVTHWIVYNGYFSTAFDAYCDRDREMRKAFNEVGGAIQWIDNPLNILIFACQFTAFFGDDGVLRVRFANGFDNNRFCGFIDVSHKVIAAFLAGFYGIWGLVVFGNYITRLARCAHGDGQHRMLHRLLSLDVKEQGYSKTAQSIAASSDHVSRL